MREIVVTPMYSNCTKRRATAPDKRKLRTNWRGGTHQELSSSGIVLVPRSLTGDPKVGRDRWARRTVPSRPAVAPYLQTCLQSSKGRHAVRLLQTLAASSHGSIVSPRPHEKNPRLFRCR